MNDVHSQKMQVHSSGLLKVMTFFSMVLWWYMLQDVMQR